MAIVTRKSAYAVKVESTEGTPVSPTAATDYIPIQADATMSPEFDTLENAELKASIGASKSILGFENPTSSVSVYLTGSGTPGTAPQVDELLTAAFGNEDVESTEYDTVGASTVSAVNVDTGEGATFRRGQALLVKHPGNAHEIRAVHSVAGDVLTPSFNLANAPGTGVDLGLATTYYPADDDHQTLSLWHYLGNGGATQMISGSRVTDLGIEFTAGELINASYSLEGLEYFFNPIEITSSDIYLDFTDDQGTFAARIDAKFYKDPHDLASALTSAMNALTSETHSVTYSDSTGLFTVSTSTSAVLSLLWDSGTNAANTVGDKIGFDTASDDTGSTSYAANNALSFASPQSPNFSNHGDPLAAKNNEVFLGSADDNVCFQASSVSFTLTDERQTIDSMCATSGRSGSTIQSRSVTVSVTALLEQYDVDQFRRFRENSETRFQVNFGTKSGGNYEPGKSGCLYIPTATITTFNVVDDDGLVTLELELTAFVNNDGDEEVFLSFV